MWPLRGFWVFLFCFLSCLDDWFLVLFGNCAGYMFVSDCIVSLKMWVWGWYRKTVFYLGLKTSLAQPSPAQPRPAHPFHQWAFVSVGFLDFRYLLKWFDRKHDLFNKWIKLKCAWTDTYDLNPLITLRSFHIFYHVQDFFLYLFCFYIILILSLIYFVFIIFWKDKLILFFILKCLWNKFHNF